MQWKVKKKNDQSYKLAVRIPIKDAKGIYENKERFNDLAVTAKRIKNMNSNQ